MLATKHVNPDTQVLVSVAMPIYNAGAYLIEAVNSIVDQTYPHWELIIIDDGSTDNAISHVEAIHDKRIKIYKDGSNKGLAARLNEAINLASGFYLARMDQDDIALPDRFMSQVIALNSNPDLDLLATRILEINNKGELVGESGFSTMHQQICSKPWFGFPMPHPTWMGKLSWFKQHYYKVPQTYYSEDYELLLRSYQSSQFECLQSCQLKYRIKESVRWRNQYKARKAVLTVQLAHFYKNKQYIYLLLSLFTFYIKILKDFYSIIMQKFKYRRASL